MTTTTDPIAADLSRAFGGGVDFARIVKFEESNLTLSVTDAAGKKGELLLTSPQARADLLYRVADRCAPLLRARLHALRQSGATLPGRKVTWYIPYLFAELFLCFLVIPVMSILDEPLPRWSYVLVWLAAVGAAIHVFVRMRRALEHAAVWTLEPSPETGFARVRFWRSAIPLDAAKFDISDWGKGRAVLTDGTQRIAIPIGEREGAFMVFAALLEVCGSPDDRLVD